MKGNRNPRVVFYTIILLATTLICIFLTLNLLSNTFGIVDLSILHLAGLYLLLGVILFNLPLQGIFREFKRKTCI